MRGYLSARSRGRVAANRGTNGFRPAMAPLISSTLDNVHDGEKLMLWGGQSIVFGRLEEISRYEVSSPMEAESCLMASVPCLAADSSSSIEMPL